MSPDSGDSPDLIREAGTSPAQDAEVSGSSAAPGEGTTATSPEGQSSGSPGADASQEGTGSSRSGQDAPAQDADADQEMSLLDHLSELRIRLMHCLIAAAVGFLLCYAVADDMLRIFLHPLVTVLPPQSKLIATTLPEKFFTVLKMAMLGGFLISSPYIFYQVWRFIAPGLYKEEREALIPVSIATAFFFTGGGVFGYFVVFPFAFSFFVNYVGQLITIMPTISSYFSFAVMLLVAFGVVFELPVVLYFLARIGLVTAAGLRRNRRWAILGAFILGALLTPADPISQCLMAGPLIVLYEVGIIAAALFGKKKPPVQESATTE